MQNKDYRRLGGWLLFFVIASGMGVGLNLNTITGLFMQGSLALALLLSLTAVLRIGTLVFLFRRNHGLYFCFLAEMAVMLLANLYTCAIYGWDAGAVGATIGSTISYGLWYLYLRRSRRVAVYLQPAKQGDICAVPQMGSAAPGESLCPRCGAPVRSGVHYCGQCGAEIQQR